MDYSWTHLLDSEYSVQDLARELSAGFLNFVKHESYALDAAIVCKILMSFLYLSDDQLAVLQDAVVGFCAACEADDEEWLRVVAAIVLEWLKKKDHKESRDAFSQVVENCKSQIETNRDHSSASTKRSKSSFRDILPMHWPYLDSSALPTNFDEAHVKKNHHFTPRSVNPVVVVASTEVALPAKLQELLEGAKLLTPENRAVIQRFFTSPSTFTEEVVIVLYEEVRQVTAPPEDVGKVQTATISVKLDPKNSKWTKVTKLGPKR